MKYFPLLLLSCLLACSNAKVSPVDIAPSDGHFGKVIGTVAGNDVQLTADQSKLADSWHSAANRSGLGFERFEIKRENDRFYLLGTDADSNTSGLVELVSDNGRLYEKKMDGSGRYMLCSGCKGEGGRPKLSETGGGYCTDCATGNCEKTSGLTDYPVLGK